MQTRGAVYWATLRWTTVTQAWTAALLIQVCAWVTPITTFWGAIWQTSAPLHVPHWFFQPDRAQNLLQVFVIPAWSPSGTPITMKLHISPEGLLIGLKVSISGNLWAWLTSSFLCHWRFLSQVHSFHEALYWLANIQWEKSYRLLKQLAPCELGMATHLILMSTFGDRIFFQCSGASLWAASWWWCFLFTILSLQGKWRSS
jgi:hypothetical protein